MLSNCLQLSSIIAELAVFSVRIRCRNSSSLAADGIRPCRRPGDRSAGSDRRRPSDAEVAAGDYEGRGVSGGRGNRPLPTKPPNRGRTMMDWSEGEIRWIALDASATGRGGRSSDGGLTQPLWPDLVPGGLFTGIAAGSIGRFREGGGGDLSWPASRGPRRSFWDSMASSLLDVGLVLRRRSDSTPLRSFLETLC